MLILSFESSCDETSCAVVRMGDGIREILSNIIASQISIHKLYGGVVPEIASRAHVEAISKITYKALNEAKVSLDDIDIIGVTNAPGLIGALLVGVNFAKSLAFANNKPLVAVNHIRGHIAANYFTHKGLTPPFTALVTSGGHTSIIDVKDYTDFQTIGVTRDDAIGEAFDKVGRVMGLPYPGGKEMDRLASLGDKDSIKLPLGAIKDDTLDFSFSGLKTHIINYINTLTQKGLAIPREDIAASFTKTVCDSVIIKVSKALERTGTNKLVCAGGVCANSHLRCALNDYCSQNNIELYLPEISLCGDNGAMIGAQAYYEFLSGNTADEVLNAYATKRT